MYRVATISNTTVGISKNWWKSKYRWKDKKWADGTQEEN